VDYPRIFCVPRTLQDLDLLVRASLAVLVGSSILVPCEVQPPLLGSNLKDPSLLSVDPLY
jgi:hypothetical protein